MAQVDFPPFIRHPNPFQLGSKLDARFQWKELEQCPQTPATCTLLCLPEAGKGAMRGKEKVFESSRASVPPPFSAFKDHLSLLSR